MPTSQVQSPAVSRPGPHVPSEMGRDRTAGRAFRTEQSHGQVGTCGLLTDEPSDQDLVAGQEGGTGRCLLVC